MRKETKLLFIVLAIGFIWRLAFSWQPVRSISNYILVDDSFYTFSIARNLALGKGMTCDGVHPTNGFQPLYVFLSVPFYWLFPQDKIFPIHLILSSLSIVSVFTGIFIFKLLKLLVNEESALFAVFFWYLSPVVLQHDINGLETGLSVMFMLWSAYYYLACVRDKEISMRNCSLLGILLGLTVLSRVDALLYCVAMGIDFMWKGKRQLREKIYPAAMVVGSCFLVVSPWFLNNLYQFGSIMPMSGRAVRLISLAPTVSGFRKAGVHFPIDPIPWEYYWVNIQRSLIKMGHSPVVEAIFWPGRFFSKEWLGYLSLGLVGTLGIALTVYYREQVKQYIMCSKIKCFNYSLVFCLIMVSSYSFYIFGQWYYLRYYFPILAVSIIYSGFAYDLYFNELLPRVSKSLARNLKVILIVFFLVISNYRLGAFYFTPPYTFVEEYYNIVSWVSENLPADAKIGTFQSGIIGYLADTQVVINLDGVVNQDAFQAMKNKNMLDYIESEGIQYVLDWPQLIRAFLWDASAPDVDRNRLRLLETGIPQFKVYQVVANAA